MGVSQNKYERGQSIGELLIAITVAGIFVTGATITVTTALRAGVAQQGQQSGVTFGQELLDQVNVVATANWHDIDTPPACASGQYYIGVSGTKLAVFCGPETRDLNASLSVNGLDYVRYFSINPVCRATTTGGDIVACGANNDPSTRQIIVNVTWSPNGPASPLQFSRYVTRGRTVVSQDTSWDALNPYADKDLKIQDGPSITLVP